jgi:acylglycerol lipase
MVKHIVFGVERDLDIPHQVFPNEQELTDMEAELPGCQHGWFESVHESAQLHYRKFLPENNKPPKAVVVFMHGIATHSGKGFTLNGRKLCMALLSDACNAQDWAVYAYDLYGHGFSEGKRFFIPNSWETNRQDLVNFCNLAAEDYPDVPLFIVGESYGCTLTILAAKQFQEHPETGPKNFNSIVLTAPAIIGDLPPYPVYFTLRYIMAPLFPSWRPFFMPNPVSADRIWRDPEVLAKCSTPRQRSMQIDGSGLPFRLGTAVNLVTALEAVRTKAIPGFRLPYCIIHGTEDYGVPIAGSEYMWKTAVTPATCRVFRRQPGAYHDLLSDPTAEHTMQTILDFIRAQLSKT